MRYTGWMRWRGDKTGLGKYEGAARKLLGALEQRLKLGEVETGVQRRKLDDGALVEVAWFKGQPVVRVTPPLRPGGEQPVMPACELYVESGLLDLGPNIAADAGERFNRGAPQFDNSPALLYFGDAVTCADKLNGKVQVALRGRQVGMRSTCAGEAGGAAVESKLTDPAKKQAQAMLPASCWTGLMQRYVAAVYGGSSVEYKYGSNALQVMSGGEVKHSLTPWMSNSWGLIKLGNRLLFVRIVDTTVFFHAVHFGTCGAYVFEFWRLMKRDTAPQRAVADKVLSVAMSDCIPGTDPIGSVVIPLTDDLEIGAYGWAFGEAKACAVMAGATTATVYELTFLIDDNGDPTASLVVVEQKKLPPASVVPRPQVARLDGQRAYLTPSSLVTSFVDAEYDTPVAAWYDDSGAMVVTRFFASITGASPFDALSYQCSSETLLTLTDFYALDPLADITCFAKFSKSTVRNVFIDRPRAATFASGFYSPSATSIQSRTTMVTISNAIIAPSFPAQALSGNQCRYSVVARIGDITFDNAGVWAVSGLSEGSSGGNFQNSTSIHGDFPSGYPDTPFVMTDGHSTGFNSGLPPVVCTRYTYQWNEVLIDNATVEAGCPAAFPVALRWDNDFSDSTVCSGVTSTTSYSHAWFPKLRSTSLIYDTPSHCAIELLGDRRKLMFASYSMDGISNVGGTVVGVDTGAKINNVTLAGDAWLVCRASASVDTKQQCFAIDIVDPSGPVTGPSRTEQTILPSLAPGAYVPPSSGVVGSYSRSSGDSGAIPAGTYAKEKAELILDASSFSTEGYVFTATPAVGAFAWDSFPASYESVSCPAATKAFDHIGPAGVAYEAGDPINMAAEYADGSHALRDRHLTELTTSDPVFAAGFSYRAMRSLLGAEVLPELSLDFGAQIEMDRETISGGYSKVGWPSFVGWA